MNIPYILVHEDVMSFSSILNFSLKIGRRVAQSAKGAPIVPTGLSSVAATPTGRRGGRNAFFDRANLVGNS